ncbi:MAG: membrane dipeptidase, partial [Clostridia bacterium]|nr:membrane dipeptidase [Clostridia bacterium]
DSGGAVGVNFYPPFLGKHTPAEHIAYLMNVGGEDAVAVGSDFEGIEQSFYPSPTHVRKDLPYALKKEGLTERQIEKILKKNAIRVLFE